MLNSVEWKHFNLNELFDISSGKRLRRMDHIDGDIKYVSSTQYNNGVDGFIGNGFTHQNAITIGAYGGVGESFYHPDKFWASDSVNVITPKKISLNSYIGLFLVTIIRQEQYRYSYGRGLSVSRLKNTSIKLPINSDGNPNWEFMEEYMKKISKGNLEGFSLPKNDTRLSLNDREWGEFRLEDLFEFDRGKRFSVNNIKNPNGIYPIITASENMPDTKTIHNEFIVNNKHSIIVNRSGTTGHVRYIKGAFCPTENVYILTAKKDININEFNSLFITTILQREKFRYMYGRTSSAGRLKNTIIKLPIKPKSSPDEKSEPDWEFMENYIKGLPYTNKL